MRPVAHILQLKARETILCQVTVSNCWIVFLILQISLVENLLIGGKLEAFTVGTLFLCEFLSLCETINTSAYKSA